MPSLVLCSAYCGGNCKGFKYDYETGTCTMSMFVTTPDPTVPNSGLETMWVSNDGFDASDFNGPLTVDCSRTDIYNVYGNKAYYKTDLDLSAESALDFCQSIKGRLATLKTQFEFSTAHSLSGDYFKVLIFVNIHLSTKYIFPVWTKIFMTHRPPMHMLPFKCCNLQY